MTMRINEISEWDLAKKFHEIYEQKALDFGWNTQEKSKVEFKDLPKENLSTMVTTSKIILDWLKE